MWIVRSVTVDRFQSLDFPLVCRFSFSRFPILYTFQSTFYFLPFYLFILPSVHLVIGSSFHLSIYLPFPPSISTLFPSTDPTIPPFHGTLRLYRHSATVALKKGACSDLTIRCTRPRYPFEFLLDGAFDPDCSLCSLWSLGVRLAVVILPVLLRSRVLSLFRSPLGLVLEGACLLFTLETRKVPPPSRI